MSVVKSAISVNLKDEEKQSYLLLHQINKDTNILSLYFDLQN